MKPHLISYGTILSPSVYMSTQKSLKKMETVRGLDWLSFWNTHCESIKLSDYLYREFGCEIFDEDFFSFLFNEIHKDSVSQDNIIIDDEAVKKYIHKVGKDNIIRKYKSEERFCNSITILDMVNHKTYIKHFRPCTTMRQLVKEGLVKKYLKEWGFDPSKVKWLISNEIIIDEKVNHMRIDEEKY